MIYRFLEPEEYGVVELIYRGLGHEQYFPKPETAKVAVVEADGKIIAIVVGQLLLQMGPIWVDDEYKGTVNLRRLQRMHEKRMKSGTQYFSFAGSEWVAKLCTRLGMVKVDTALFRKEIHNGNV